MKPTQQNIAKLLNVSQPFINQIMAGKKSVSWPLAEKLSDLFPGKTMREWKKANPSEIKRAFTQIKEVA
jgi:plasmid maintenance system antidote protein VapI